MMSIPYVFIVPDDTINNMSDSTETTATSRQRAPRKRATRELLRQAGAVDSGARIVRPKTTLKRVKKDTTSLPPEERAPEVSDTAINEKVSPTRKAPTKFFSNRGKIKQKRKQQVIVAVLIFLGVGASALVGFSDTGRIDINSAIQARNERVQNNEGDDRETEGGILSLPVHDSNPKHTAETLRGRGSGGQQPPIAEKIPESPATTTESNSDDNGGEESSVDEQSESIVTEITGTNENNEDREPVEENNTPTQTPSEREETDDLD